MTWLGLSLLTVALWTGWSFLGKIALRDTAPLQATIIFGLASVAVGVVSLALISHETLSWSPGSVWLTVVSATLGGAGLVTFYLALERGKASNVTPIIGMYPALVAVLSVAFLSERLSALQVLGVALAITGVVLVGSGA